MKLIIFFFSPRPDGITKHSRVKENFWKTRTHFRRVRVSTITTNHTFMAISRRVEEEQGREEKAQRHIIKT